MRYGIFSDIHGNLEALQAVLTKLQQERVDKYICSGDIVGYGGNPRECLQLVLDMHSLIVAGNHDYAVAGRFNPDFFDIYNFVEIIPNWEGVSVGLKTILLDSGRDDCLGWHRPGIVAICAWPNELPQRWDKEFVLELLINSR